MHAFPLPTRHQLMQLKTRKTDMTNIHPRQTRDRTHRRDPTFAAHGNRQFVPPSALAFSGRVFAKMRLAARTPKLLIAEGKCETGERQGAVLSLSLPHPSLSRLRQVFVMRTGTNIIAVDEMMMIHPSSFHDLDEKIEYSAVLGGDTVQILSDCPICCISASANLKRGAYCNLQHGDGFKFCYLKDCGQADATRTDLNAVIGREKNRASAKEWLRFRVRDHLYK